MVKWKGHESNKIEFNIHELHEILTRNGWMTIIILANNTNNIIIEVFDDKSEIDCHDH